MRRTTRTKVNRVVLYVVLAAILLVLGAVADWSAIKENFFDTTVIKSLFPEIVTVAAKNTIIYTAIAFVGGLVFALLLALMKLSPVAPYRWLATGYIEFFRGLPALVVIIAFGFAVPIAFNWRPPGGTIGAGIIALIIVSAAYMAETIRAGIQAVPKGQTEAARSLGMTGAWTTTSVILPQAFRIIIPPLTNELVILIKDTSLLFVIGAAANQRELTTFARDSMSSTQNSSPLLAAAVLYLIITLPLTRLVARLERRTQKAR
ncbi:MAG TPA: amino acid ABC transporter permease [Thermoanaerobaculia bacterium]|nr:amino acid ABC transporter permease [Thermoanaerobaculia bacterium]